MLNSGTCVQIGEAEAAVVIESAPLVGGGNVYKVLRAFDDADGETAYVKDPIAHAPGGPLCAECPLWYAGRCGLACLDLE